MFIYLHFSEYYHFVLFPLKDCFQVNFSNLIPLTIISILWIKVCPISLKRWVNFISQIVGKLSLVGFTLHYIPGSERKYAPLKKLIKNHLTQNNRFFLIHRRENISEIALEMLRNSPINHLTGTHTQKKQLEIEVYFLLCSTSLQPKSASHQKHENHASHQWCHKTF